MICNKSKWDRKQAWNLRILLVNFFFFPEGTEEDEAGGRSRGGGPFIVK